MKYRFLLLMVLILGITLGIWQPMTVDAQAAATGRLRVVHLISGAPAVDVYINGTQVAGEVEFGRGSLHFAVPAGAAQVEIRPAGRDAASPAVFSQAVDVAQDLAFSLVLQGSQSSLQGAVYEDVLDPLTPGLARLAVVHAIPDAPAIDVVRTDGTPFAPLMVGVAFNTPYGTINIPAGSYPLAVVPTGLAAAGESDVLADLGKLDLRSGISYTVFVADRGGEAQTFVLGSAAKLNPGDSPNRLVHAAPDAPAVDVYLNETLAIPNLAFGDTTPHIALPSGEHAFALREAGTPPNSEPIFSDTLNITEAAQTIAIVPGEEGLALLYIADAVDGIVPDQGRVQVIDLSGEGTEFTIAGEMLTPDSPVDLKPGDYAISGTADFEARIYGGVLYTVLVVGGDAEIALTRTPLNVQLTSTPFETTSTVAAVEVVPAATEEANDSSEVAAVTSADTPTEVSSGTTTSAEVGSSELLTTSQGAAVGESQPAIQIQVQPANQVPAQPAQQEGQAAPVQPTAQPPVQEQPPVATATPVQPPQVQPAQPQPGTRPTKPGIYPPVEIVFGIVNLNQGVNLQCREYPDPSARSLGLIPNGTELVIVGLPAPRDTTGEIGFPDAITIDNIIDFSPILPEDITVDDVPLAQLESIDPDTFWLNVDWVLPDGTAFGCWVAARYVEINFDNERIDETIEYLRLVDNKNFDLIPYNVPGGPRDPNVVVNPQDVSAPTPRPSQDFILATVNVNRGVNLQFRRTPGVDGESLALVPGGSQLAVLAKTEIPVTGAPGEPTIPEWLYAVFIQPDGVQVAGWVSAEYVLLTRGGRLVTLDDVPTVRGALADLPRGGFIDPETGEVLPEVTDVTGGQPQGQGQQQPTQQQPSQNQVIGRLLIDPGANLNMRDLPTTDGLVRVSLPWDAVLLVLGRNGAGDWLNVVYTTANGDVSGWVAAELVELTLQGQRIDVGQLPIVTGEPDTYVP